VLFALSLAGILAQAAPSAGAIGGTRPQECGFVQGTGAANVWERAKEPELRRYCDLLAKGTAHLVASKALVGDVVGIAAEADKLLPGRAAPRVLAGRALLELGKPADALAALKDARARDDRALDDPVALLAWARANARTGHLAEAATAYRAALPRTSALAPSERSAASFEAGMIVMAQGPKGIDDAVAMLRQARIATTDALQLASVVALALALDRADLRDESRAILNERVRGNATPVLTDPRVAEALADAGVPFETDALQAIALEAVDPSAAREAWTRYLTGPGGKSPWSDHARQHQSSPHAAAPARPHGPR
jgi:hypothetical protein